MKEFFVSLFAAAVAGGLCSVLGGKAYEKHIKYISALVFTAVLMSPLFSLFGASLPSGELDLPEISVDGAAAEELLAKQIEKDSTETLLSYIFAKTGIKPTAVSIQIESVEGEYHVRRIAVRTGNADGVAAVRSCLEELHHGEVPTEVTE